MTAMHLFIFRHFGFRSHGVYVCVHQALSRPPILKMADNMADRKPLDCNIIIKNPVLLNVGDVGNDFRSGVSVIDIIFPGNNNVEVRLQTVFGPLLLILYLF